MKYALEAMAIIQLPNLRIVDTVSGVKIDAPVSGEWCPTLPLCFLLMFVPICPLARLFHERSRECT